ncbi:MAG: MFS transporter [Limimaricola sp.]|nr:MFS transporter [Limimaricola sp.]
MENLDASVLSTSLPVIAGDLHTDPILLKLALTSYLLALAIFIPASGWAADRFGARRVFRMAISVFALGSIACGLSDTLTQLVLARVMQGIGGSMMVPVGRLIVLRATEKSGLVAALAWLTVPALMGPVMGPPLGGFITTYFHWRWIFWINIPIAVLGIVLVSVFIPRLPPGPRVTFDAVGFLMIGPGLAAFLTGLTMAGLSIATPAMVAALTLGGLALIVAYVRHSFRVAVPLVDLRLLALPSFRIAAAGGAMFRSGGGAMPFLLPLMFQLGFGLSAFQSGMMTFATGAGAMLMKFTAQPILQRWGFRRVLTVNALIAGLFLLSPAFFTAQTPYALMVVVLFVGGVSRSLQFTASNAMAYAEVDAARLSSATSFNAVLQQLSSTVGITLAAFGLETAQRIFGGASLSAVHFPLVFAMVGLVASGSALWFARLGPEADGALLAQRG